MKKLFAILLSISLLSCVKNNNEDIDRRVYQISSKTYSVMEISTLFKRGDTVSLKLGTDNHGNGVYDKFIVVDSVSKYTVLIDTLKFKPTSP